MRKTFYSIVVFSLIFLIIISTKSIVKPNEQSDLGSLEEIVKNENIAEEAKTLKEGMLKSEVKKMLVSEPIESGVLEKREEYNSFETYKLSDGREYDFFYNDDKLVAMTSILSY